MIINQGDGVDQKKSGHIPYNDMKKVGVLDQDTKEMGKQESFPWTKVNGFDSACLSLVRTRELSRQRLFLKQVSWRVRRPGRTWKGPAGRQGRNKNASVSST